MCRLHNTHGIQSIIHVIGEIAILPNRLQEILLLALAQLIMIGLVFCINPLIGFGKGSVGLQLTMMQTQGLRLGVGIDLSRSSSGPRFLGLDGDSALWTDHILHEEGHLAHHWAPARLIPTNRSVLEGHLQLAVINHSLWQLIT